MKVRCGPDALSAVNFLWSYVIGMAQEEFLDDCELGG